MLRWRLPFIICAVLLVWGLPAVSQGQGKPAPKITPLWEITLPICPAVERCAEIWRLSADGEHLFLYVDPPSTFYVFDKGRNLVTAYPNIEFIQTKDQFFDYLPVDDHTVLYLNTPQAGMLTRLDLSTGENEAFAVERGLRSCLTRNAIYGYEPPFRSMHAIPSTNFILVCRHTSDVAFAASKVNLQTAAVTDLFQLPQEDYLNVVSGADGAFYLEPGVNEYLSLIPNYRERYESTCFILRLNADASWQVIEIPKALLKQNKMYFQRFFGVDAQSNLYFHTYEEQGMQITQIDSSGKISQVITKDQLGWNPQLIGLNASGELIILNRMNLSSESTPTYIISRYEFPFETTPSP